MKTLVSPQIKHLLQRGVAWASVFLLMNFYLIRSASAESAKLAIEYTFAPQEVQYPSQLSNQESWSPFDSQKNKLSPLKGKHLWLKISPQNSSIDELTLKFEKIFMRFKVFSSKDEVVYSFGDGGGYPGFPPHLITLQPTASHSEYYMRVESEHQRIGPVGKIAIGQRANFILQMIKEDLVPLFVISILALLSLAGLILFALHRNVRTYLHLALFSASAFLYIIAGLRLRHQLGLNPALLGNVSLLALFFTPFFFINFYFEIFSLKQNKWSKNALRLNVIFIIFSSVGYFVSPLGFLPFLTFFYALALPVFASIFVHSLKKLRNHDYSKTFYLGFLFLFMGGIWEMANELRLINSNFRMLHVGILLFFLCLTAMQGQFFAKLFQTSRKNELAEIAARNRLQRVFDCTYALAQARHYREALQAVASAISNQLKLQKAQFSIDFMITRSAIAELSTNKDDFLHFTYICKGENRQGEIYEIRGSADEQQPNSLVPDDDSRDAPTSLPGIDIAGPDFLSSAPSSPASVLTVPLETDALEGAIIIRKYENATFTVDEHGQVIKFINAVSASLLIALKNIEYLREVKTKAKLDAELDAANSIQNALLPPALSLDNVALASYSRSAGKTGGDWFGHYYSEKRQRLFVTLGDVTGHDFAASILTGVAAGIIKSWESYNSDNYDSASVALEKLATHVNEVILDASRGLKMMSMIFMCIEFESGLCHVVNAGHPHPFHIVPSETPKTVVASGTLLGANLKTVYKAETIELNPNDTIVLYTDGLIENTGPAGEKISRRSMIQFCRQNDLNAKTLDNFVQFANDTWQDFPPEDDVSIVAITWKPEEMSARTVA